MERGGGGVQRHCDLADLTAKFSRPAAGEDK